MDGSAARHVVRQVVLLDLLPVEVDVEGGARAPVRLQLSAHVSVFNRKFKGPSGSV
eukprot:COSAG06_NODE_3554_length_5196_cov_4.040024_3_plen_56_part_00